MNFQNVSPRAMFQVQITNYMSTASLPRSKSGWTQFSFSLEAYSEPLRSIHQLHARVLLQSFCSFSGGVECPLKGLYFSRIYIFHPEQHTLSASGQYPKWPQQKSFSQQCQSTIKIHGEFFNWSRPENIVKNVNTLIMAKFSTIKGWCTVRIAA